jgi:two-component system chemotaxis sensor kinase CheA
MDEFRKKFIEEATDLINALESSVLSLENNANDKEIINEVFRIMHSLKGGGAMFGFLAISEFTHNLENIYDEIRTNKKSITKDLLDITFISVDHLRNLIKSDADTNQAVQNKQKELLAKISSYVNEKTEIVTEENTADEQNNNISTYYIVFKPNKDIFDNGTNPLFLLDDIAKLGNSYPVVRAKDVPGIGAIDYTRCYIYWEIFLETSQNESEISDIFMFVEDDCDLSVTKISETNTISDLRFVELLNDADNGVIFEPEEINAIIKSLKKVVEEPQSIQNADDKIKKFSKESEITSIRIATEKIDIYMNLVSELVTALAGLKLSTTRLADPDLIEITENIENITDQIRDNALSITLIPIENTVVRFRRLVRDLSADFNKSIDFQTIGTDTTIDKTLLQIITDPLMHIIRNSIDHGIEYPDQRVKNGKSPIGNITLRAYRSGSNVHIEVEDDGKGLDVERIMSKAKEKNFVSQETPVSKAEAIKVIFHPGFSTVDKITDISGRGVGMDVLKRKMFDVRGDIYVETEKNKGTKITLKVPLTLSIVDGLLVTLRDKLYIIPLTSIARIKDVTYKFLTETSRNVAIIDNKQVPFYMLRDELDIKGDYPEEVKFIMIKYEGKHVGLVFDTIIGEYQAVLKPLGKLYKKHEIISGASILGNGKVALVLDTNKIIQKFSETSNQ